MNKEIGLKWVEALESGEYEQGIGLLRSDNDKFCCLGVLCDIMPTREWGKGQFGWFATGIEGYPTECRHSIDAFTRDEVGMTGEEEGHLIGLNDSEGLSFTEIASYIRENLLNDE